VSKIRAGEKTRSMSAVRRSFLALCLAFALTGAAVARPVPASAVTFGANVSSLFSPNLPWPKDVSAALTSLHGIGASVARTDTFWATAEPQPPVDGKLTYSWSYDNRVALALARAGLRWQPIVDYATWWSGDGAAGPEAGLAPGYIGYYAAYAQAFARRFGVGGTFWKNTPGVPYLPVKVFEVWNEPDIPIFWEPTPNLAEYAALYLYTRAAIHAVDPTAKVIIGGLVYASTSLPALYAAQPSLRGNTDGVAIHPYRGSADGMETAVNYDISLDASTVDAPIYINEYGWNGTPGTWQGVTEAKREDYTKQATELIARDPDVVDMEPFCWGCGQDYDSAFELYNTPAGAAYARAIAADKKYITPP
jgi:polysaccharide biosynthesis protein PslG